MIDENSKSVSISVPYSGEPSRALDGAAAILRHSGFAIAQRGAQTLHATNDRKTWDKRAPLAAFAAVDVTVESRTLVAVGDYSKIARVVKFVVGLIVVLDVGTVLVMAFLWLVLGHENLKLATIIIAASMLPSAVIVGVVIPIAARQQAKKSLEALASHSAASA